MLPTLGKISCAVVAAVLTLAEPVEALIGSEALGSIATRPGRIVLRLAAAAVEEARGRVEELGAGGARIAEREEKARRIMKVDMIVSLKVMCGFC